LNERLAFLAEAGVFVAVFQHNLHLPDLTDELNQPNRSTSTGVSLSIERDNARGPPTLGIGKIQKQHKVAQQYVSDSKNCLVTMIGKDLNKPFADHPANSISVWNAELQSFM
jgi:hypothetical protein